MSYQNEDKTKNLNEKQAIIVSWLNELNSDDQRLEVLHCFCNYCGEFTPNYSCQCSNDE